MKSQIWGKQSKSGGQAIGDGLASDGRQVGRGASIEMEGHAVSGTQVRRGWAWQRPLVVVANTWISLAPEATNQHGRQTLHYTYTFVWEEAGKCCVVACQAARSCFSSVKK